MKHVYLPDRVLGTLHRYKKYRLYQNTLSETYTDHIKIQKKTLKFKFLLNFVYHELGLFVKQNISKIDLSKFA